MYKKILFFITVLISSLFFNSSSVFADTTTEYFYNTTGYYKDDNYGYETKLQYSGSDVYLPFFYKGVHYADPNLYLVGIFEYNDSAPYGVKNTKFIGKTTYSNDEEDIIHANYTGSWRNSDNITDFEIN